MRNCLLLSLSLLIAASSQAGNLQYVASGSTLVTGPISHPVLGQGSQHNPAALVNNTHRARISLIDVNLGIAVQGLGEFNTAFEELSDQLNEIDRVFTAFGDDNATVGEVLSEVNAMEAAFDTNVERLADNLYIKPHLLISAPFTPLDINLGDHGTLSVSASSLTQARGGLLHGPIEFEINAQTVNDANDDNIDLDPIDYLRTTSSVYLKQAQVWNASLGYARPLPEMALLERNGFDATFGARATLIGYRLQKNLYPLKSLARAATEDDSELFDRIAADIQDGFSDYQFTAAVDLGFSLTRGNSQYGLTLYNLNSPSLRYNSLGGDCAALATESEQTNCFHAEYFASVGDIALKEEHVMSPHLTLDANRSWLNQRLILAGSADLWRKTDLFGETRQDLKVSFIAQPTAWYWPGMRLGAGKDLQDIDATALGAGLTFFRFFHLDAAMNAVWGDLNSSDATRAGNALRSAQVAASFDIRF